MAQQDFDNAVAAFNITISHVLNWRDSYAGASYPTRLRSAIKDARIACDRLEKALAKSSERDRPRNDGTAVDPDGEPGS